MIKRLLTKLFSYWTYSTGKTPDQVEPVLMYHSNENGHYIHNMRRSTCMHWGMRFFKPHIRLEVSVGNEFESDFTFDINLPYLLGFHISFDYRQFEWVKDWIGKGNGNRCFGFYTCESHLRVNWYHDDMGYYDNHGWHLHLDWEDLFKGERTVSDPVLGDVSIVLRTTYQFGDYPIQLLRLTVVPETYTVKYSRWIGHPFTRYSISSDQVSVYQGKGENSWDCDPVGMDSLSVGCDANSCSEAGYRYVEHLHDCRKRYG